MNRFDALVLGGGMAGAAVAAHLAGRRRIALLEREPALAVHATGRSAAMWLPSYGGAAVRPLTLASRPFLTDPPGGFVGSLLAPRAALHVARREQLDVLGALAAEHPRLRPLSGVEARRRVPILRPEAAHAALLETDAGDIDVARLHARFVAMARAGGAEILTALGELRIGRVGPFWEVSAAGQVWRAPILVNAAGAWADDVAVAAGLAPLGLTPLRRTVVLVDPPASPGFGGWPVVKDVDERFYFRPFSGRLLVTPADETLSEPRDAQPDDLDVARAMARLEKACDHAVARVRYRWAGLRTFAADRAPVVGWSRDHPGFFWIAGLGGFGIQAAPALGRMAAAILLGDPMPAELVDHGVMARFYDPERPATTRRSA
ncbi:MAG TPA: FAD-binding oxidoreductase [Caulobacteraceae bacterium]